ncbi:MAG TPA: Hsp20/alpha crystallin family protein [Chitinophagaceae bacterium]|nr:Hsp20/alpha crystallin family protein [Chitinophagaceae bacterium]
MLVKVNHRPMHRTFNSIFDELFNEFPVKFDSGLQTPAVNIHENENAYVMELNVPGRKKEDFQISLENGLLTVSFEKKEENNTENQKVIRREFSYQSFKRSFNLDKNIDTENIQAKYENGILALTLPKKEAAKPSKKEINIQ